VEVKSREQWLVEWGLVPGWAKAVFALAIWLVVLAVASLEMELRQPARPVHKPQETTWR